jgi:GNAT superfamily N-acetyltransferase
VTEVAANIRALAPDAYRSAIPALADLVVDAVRAGASINFLATVTPDEAGRWWADRAPAVDSGVITAFAAFDGDRLIGSVLLMRSVNANSPHRAEIGKVIVHTSARRLGLGSALMVAAEERARADGRWLLVLDTVTDSPADALYRSLGWHVTGTVPNYALLPDGRPWPATFFWKDLR